jgi:hypothetical protein
VQASEVLDEAAAYIEENGWIQKAYFRFPADVNHKMFTANEGELWRDFVTRAKGRGCRACALGAIEAAAVGDRRLVMKAEKYLELVTETPFIPAWNDAKGRTQNDVVAALKVAASAARKDEK